MKKYVWIFFLPVMLIAGFSCNQSLDVDNEKDALIAVCEEERDAYFARDIDRLESVWMHEPTSRRLWCNRNGITELNGWQEIDTNYEEDFKNEEKWENMADVSAEFSNYDIQVFSNTALVYHDLRWTGTYKGEVLDAARKRIVHFVKEGGDWKFQMTTHIEIPDEDVSENKKTAALYHELKPENINLILAEDFIGRTEKNRHTWSRENHRNYLSNGNYKRDSIFQQVADGNWVATRFFREIDYQGAKVKFEAMHFKRFENGKIAEIWEYGDSQQAE